MQKRLLIKVSGEALLGQNSFGIDLPTVEHVADELIAAAEAGWQLAVVVGGGNIFRGLSVAAKGMERAGADYVGMLATVMNALIMQNALERKGSPTRILSAIEMTSVCEPYIRRRALRHLEKGRIVIFGAGTGNPFFTTDTAAALRAAEMGCGVFLKGTSVDGVYDKDPKRFPEAKRYERLTYDRMLADDLRVMDITAITLAKENDIPVIVFSIKRPGSLLDALTGKGPCTIVTTKKERKIGCLS